MAECGCCFCLSFTKDSYRDFKKRPSQLSSKVSPSKESSGESSSVAWAAVIAWVVVADDAEELEELHNDPFKTRVAGLNYKYSRA